MKQQLTRKSDLLHLRVVQLLLILGPAMTLIVNPWTNYDPISLPKFIVLVSVSFSILFFIFMSRVEFLEAIPKGLLGVAVLFVFWMVLTLMFSGAPLNQQIWGSFGRNTGFLTYVSLVIVLLACVWQRGAAFYKRLTWLFVLTSIPMTAYCLIQVSGNDPIPWSEFNTFGTLGNINFLSAFLGMTSIASFVLASAAETKIGKRLSLLALVLVDLWIIYSTGSIQGPVVFVVGVCAFTLIQMNQINRFRRTLLVGFSSLIAFLTYLMVLALQNLGPLAKFVYQPSVVFRSDYIHAGWEMTTKRPFFGVGMDSYGDWYRESRGELSTLRTGPNRISNTAHNIFLDISSNGGFVLGILYFALAIFALTLGLRVVTSRKTSNTYFNAVFCVWIAYQVQALVSINQIGIGVWGWMFTGVVIGFYLLQKDEHNSDKYFIRRRDFRGKPLGAAQSLLGILGFSLGIVLSGIPVLADARYRSASERGDLVSMIAASSSLGSTQFHRELSLEFALRNDKTQEVKEIAEGLVADYPRNFFGWRVLSVATANTPEERDIALQVVRNLDPFNPEIIG